MNLDNQTLAMGGAALVLLLVLAFVIASLRGARALAGQLRAELEELRRGHDETRARADRQAAQLEEREARLAALTGDLAEARRLHTEAEGARGQALSEGAKLAEGVRRLEEAVEVSRRGMADLTESHRLLQEEHAALQAAHSALKADTDGKLASAQREVTVLKELREEMSRSFEELAATTLRRTGADFSKAHTDKLTELLTPFREHVGRFEEELRKVHGAADQERARLSQQITMLTQQSESIRSEAANLTRALKGDKQRQGAWGEMILERILEDSGLERDLHYEIQASRRDEEGERWQPDVIVRMPRGKCLVIDSKVSLVAYEAATNTETPEERERHLRDHVAAVRRHIDTLASKGYHALERGSVDYVLMFMPIEGALSEAWRQQGDLTSYAVSKGIGIMTPTTLMVALRTVEHIWTVERRESNAEAIADRAGKLYDKVVGFVTDMENVGAHLGRAASAHEAAMGKLSLGRGNVIGQIEKLKAMGARSIKTIPIDFDPAEEDDTAPALIQPAAE